MWSTDVAADRPGPPWSRHWPGRQRPRAPGRPGRLQRSKAKVAQRAGASLFSSLCAAPPPAPTGRPVRLCSAASGRQHKIIWGFRSQFIKSTKVLMATPQGRYLGYHTPEQVSNQEPPDQPLRYSGGWLFVCSNNYLTAIFYQISLKPK